MKIDISYDIQPSIFSQHTLIAGRRGNNSVCALLFDIADTKTAETELRKMFPSVGEIEYQSVRAMNRADRVINDINDKCHDYHDLNNPVDIINGTLFQQKVWRELLKVQRGTTITYSKLAARIGAPKAVRATASAVANNPISILIPCHRVLPKSGGIGKYRWGSEMKQKLLDQEQVATNTNIEDLEVVGWVAYQEPNGSITVKQYNHNDRHTIY